MKPTAFASLAAVLVTACVTTPAARLESDLPTVERSTGTAGQAPTPSPSSPEPTAPGPTDLAAPSEAPPPSPRAGKDLDAAKALTARLAALPRCEKGATVGQLTVGTAMCTRMACPEACCNTCTWTASFVSTNGVPHLIEAARLADTLGLRASALDCEVHAWRDVLAGKDVGLDGAGCVVR